MGDRRNFNRNYDNDGPRFPRNNLEQNLNQYFSSNRPDNQQQQQPPPMNNFNNSGPGNRRRYDNNSARPSRSNVRDDYNTMSKPVQTPRDMDSRQFGDGNYYRDQKDHDNDLFRRREDNNSNRNRRTANDQDFQRRGDFNTHKEAQRNNNQDFSRRGDDNCRYDSATSYHEERRRRDEASQFSSGDNDMNRNDYNNERRGGGGGGNRFNSNTDDRGPPPHNQSSWNDDNRSRSRSRSDMNRNDYNNERRGGGGGGGNLFNSSNDDRGPPLHNQSSYNDDNRSRSRSRNDMYRNDYNNERRGGNCFNSNNDVRGPPPHNQSSYNDVNRSRNEREFENTNLFARRENVPQDTRSRHQEDAPRNYGGDFGTNYQNNQGFEGQHTRNYSPQQFGGDFGKKCPNNQGFEGQQNMNYSSQQYGKKTEFDNYTNFRNNSDFGYNNPPPAAGTFQGSTHGGFQDTNIGYFPRNNDFGGNTFMNSTNSFNQPPPAPPPGPTNFDGPPPPGGFGCNHFGYNLPQNNFGNSPQPPFTPDNISGNFPCGSGVVGVGPRNSWTANPQDFKQQNNSMNFNNKRGRSRDNSMGDGRAISPGNNERKLSGPPPNKNKDKNKKNKKNKKIKKKLKQQQKNNQNTTPQQENEATNDETTTNKKGKLRGRKKNKDVNFLRRRRQANVLKDEAQRLADAGILKKPPKNLSKCEPELYWTKWWPKYAYIENVIPRFSENEDGIKEFINFNYEPESQKLEIRKKLLLRIGCAKISRTLDINEINYPLRDVYKLFVYRKHLMDPNFHKHLTFHELHRVKVVLDNLRNKFRWALMLQSFIHRWHDSNEKQHAGERNRNAIKLQNDKLFHYLVLEAINDLKELCSNEWPGFKEFHQNLMASLEGKTYPTNPLPSDSIANAEEEDDHQDGGDEDNDNEGEEYDYDGDGGDIAEDDNEGEEDDYDDAGDIAEDGDNGDDGDENTADEEANDDATDDQPGVQE